MDMIRTQSFDKETFVLAFFKQLHSITFQTNFNSIMLGEKLNKEQQFIVLIGTYLPLGWLKEKKTFTLKSKT